MAQLSHIAETCDVYGEEEKCKQNYIRKNLKERDHLKNLDVLVGKPEGKRPLGRPRRRWVDNIKMNLRETGWNGMDWIDLAQNKDQ
jgi:hypothetical protein